MAAITAANSAAQASSNFQGDGEPSLLGLFFVLGIVITVSVVGYFMLKID